MRIADEAPLSLVIAACGTMTLCFDDGEYHRLDDGDLALVRGPDAYVVADAPTSTPTVIIHPGQRCETVDGEPLDQAMSLGVRTWGNADEPSHVLLSGTYETVAETGRRVLDALPRALVVRHGDLDPALARLLADEIVRSDIAQPLVLDRLLDLLVVVTLRAWIASDHARVPAWLAAHGDPVVGPAVRLLQETPERPWTVGQLASEIGVSRATMAKRFTDAVGEPPMAFLTGWRLACAAERLRTSSDGIATIAGEVGYGSPFALSTAFKRHYGISPHRYRTHIA